MMHMFKLLPSLLLVVLLTGCLPEDERVVPFDRGDVETQQVEMGSTYADQVYFDFSAGAVVNSVPKESWDLRIDRAGDAIQLRLNSSKYMLAAESSVTVWEALQNDDGLVYRWDPSDGSLRLALENWQEADRLFVLDRGYTAAGSVIGKVKAGFARNAAGGLNIRFGALSGTAQTVLEIALEEGRTYVSLEGNGEVVPVETGPDWDIVFTQYTTSLWDGSDTISYLVTGVLIHPEGVLATKDTAYTFAEIDAEIAREMPLVSLSDVVGFDWKEYNFDQARFQVLEGINYVLQDAEGFLIKFRFLDFYNEQGEKGAPLFEYQIL